MIFVFGQIYKLQYYSYSLSKTLIAHLWDGMDWTSEQTYFMLTR